MRRKPPEIDFQQEAASAAQAIRIGSARKCHCPCGTAWARELRWYRSTVVSQHWCFPMVLVLIAYRCEIWWMIRATGNRPS